MTRQADMAVAFLAAVLLHAAAVVGVNRLVSTPVTRPMPLLTAGEVYLETMLVGPAREPAEPASVPPEPPVSMAPPPVPEPPAPEPQPEPPPAALAEPSAETPAVVPHEPTRPPPVSEPAGEPARVAVAVLPPIRPEPRQVGTAAPVGVRDRPTALGGIRPRYPRSARLHGQEGRVGVRAGVDAAGRVVAAAVVRSSGHAVLDDAALEAVRTARFVPAERNGRPVAGETTLQFQFRLSD